MADRDDVPFGKTSDLESQTDVDQETLARYDAFRANELGRFPGHMSNIFGDSLLLNFHVISWYLSDWVYMLVFRLLFVLIFFPVPFTIGSALVALSVTDRETAGVVELLFFSVYSGPLINRAFNELSLVTRFAGLGRTLLIQADFPFIISLFVISVASKSDSSGARSLTGLGFAIPAVIIYAYMCHRRFTIYAFGAVGLYTEIPRILRHNNFPMGREPLVRRLATLQRDITGTAGRVIGRK